MTEAQLQAACFKWAWNTHPQTRGLLFHVANGEARDIRTAGKLKSMGVVPGVPDLLFLWKGKLYAFELKKPGGGKLSEKQKKIHEIWKSHEVCVKLVDSFDVFKAELEFLISG